MKTVVGGRRLVAHIALLAMLGAGILLMLGVCDGAFAQAGPFGAPRGHAPAVPVGACSAGSSPSRRNSIVSFPV